MATSSLKTASLITRSTFRPVPISSKFTRFLTLALRVATSLTLTSALSRAVAMSFRISSSRAESTLDLVAFDKALVMLAPSSAKTMLPKSFNTQMTRGGQLFFCFLLCFATSGERLLAIAGIIKVSGKLTTSIATMCEASLANAGAIGDRSTSRAISSTACTTCARPTTRARLTGGHARRTPEYHRVHVFAIL